MPSSRAAESSIQRSARPSGARRSRAKELTVAFGAVLSVSALAGDAEASSIASSATSSVTASVTSSVSSARSPAPQRARSSAALGASSAAGSSVHGKPGAASPVTLAEVAAAPQAKVPRAAEAREIVRKRAEAELAAIDWSKHSVHRKYKLSASITKLDGSQAGGRSAVSCTVTATLRDSERGTLLAIVEGRASAEASGPHRSRVERDALEGAVIGAIGGVPAALRKLK